MPDPKPTPAALSATALLASAQAASTRAAGAAAVVLAMTAAGCSATGATSTDDDSGASSSGSGAARDTEVYDESALHDVDVRIDEDDFNAMVDTYQESSDKEWIEAEVTVDGETFARSGLRLKGNSSLRGVSDDAEPTELPWLIRLDKFIDGQALEGYTEFVVRSNSTGTAMNEAVALDLLAEAGLASEHAIATSFSVNDSDPQLRLVVQHLDEAWQEENFDGDGILYKAEAEGDYSWRGDDPDSYVDVFDQETGEDDLTPLIGFLDFINNSSDAEFDEGLAEHLDVDAFATYLAYEDLVDNFDDIDGPGNNSYLHWDADSDQFTVVAWDHNLAFGTRNGGMGGGAMGGLGGDGMRGGFPGAPGERPEGMPEDMPAPGEGFAPPTGQGGRGGPGGGSNILVERFKANAEFNALYEAASTRLQADLYDSGLASDVLNRWVEVLTAHAGALVDAETIEEEASAIRESISGSSGGASDDPADEEVSSAT